MQFSPRRSLAVCRLDRRLYRKLYRNGMFAVTLAASILLAHPWLVAQVVTPQYGHKSASDKGPRALGLVQISPKGKARLIPIAIMMDGKFYDAGSYKASPVPMALDFGIVYEGFRTGVSQGVFTITQPGQLNHEWIAEGTWFPAGTKAPEKNKKYSTPVIEDKDAPPVLHRRGEATGSGSGSDNSDNKDKEKSKNDKDDNKDAQKPATAAGPSTTPPAGAPGAPTEPDAAKATAPPEPPKASAAASDEQIQDPNRPRLRRGKPDASERHEPFTTFEPLTDTAPAGTAADKGKPDANATTDSAAAAPPILIPAISDAGGPDPRPYIYDVKPAEEAIYRNKMLDLAATLVSTQPAASPKQVASARKKSAASKSVAKSPKPSFDDVRVHIFDLSNSNEPVLVFSAKTHPLTADSSEEPKEITLIARTNLEGELRKLFFSQTDSRHLDVTPRMELIDAVDADGDGRGELLFRRTSSDGSAYAIYRVSADRLWPLFEGTP